MIDIPEQSAFLDLPWSQSFSPVDWREKLWDQGILDSGFSQEKIVNEDSPYGHEFNIKIINCEFATTIILDIDH